ncbi:MAG: FAD:protein FMN transferase [Bacteroidetes bacterium]|nr:FAD:protein FMN transferase [Bacteroidota bacterium]
MNKFLTVVFLFFSFSLAVQAQNNPIKINGFAQGTTFAVTYFDNENRGFKDEIEKILQDFDHSLSLWDPTSVICRVNNNDTSVILDEYFISCFNKSQQTSVETDGAFDATVQPLVSLWGFLLNKKGNIEKKTIDSILQFVGYTKIELKDGKIIKKDPRIKLDFNGIAQGYSVDVISSFLYSKGISRFLVEIGGEVYGSNKKPDGNNWKVGIEQPMDNDENENPLKAIVKIENKGLTTAGNYRKFYIENGVKYAHTINPQTGYPTKNNLLSVTVLADNAFTADAFDTALMVMGLEKAKKYLKMHPGLQACLIYADKKGKFKTFETSEFKKITTELK